MFDNFVGILFHQSDSSLILRSAFGTILLCWIYFLWSRRKFYLLAWKLPGPIAVPFFGNFIEAGVLGNTLIVAQNLLKLSAKYSSPYVLWAGLNFTLVVSEPDDLEMILSSKVSSFKDSQYNVFQNTIGSGLISLSGPVWKRHRQILNHSFNVPTLRSYYSVYNKNAKLLMNALMEVCDKGKVEVSTYCRRFAGDVITESALDIHTGFHKGDKDHILKISSKFAEIMIDRMIKPWIRPELLFNLHKNSKINRKLKQDLESFFFPLVKDKIKKQIEMNKDSYIDSSNTEKSKSSFEVVTDAISNDNMTEQEGLLELYTLYNSGVEIIYNITGTFMVLMGMHKNVQDKLRKEIQKVFEDDRSCDVLPEHVNNMPYLDMCVKEQIRLFPIGPLLARITKEDFELKSKNITIPADTHLLMSPFIIHRNPKYWKEPNSYDPDRFLPEECQKRPNFAYVPFLHGMRNCIGKQLGIDVFKIIAVNLLRNYELHSDLKMDQLKYQCDVLTRISMGYHVSIKKLKYVE